MLTRRQFLATTAAVAMASEIAHAEEAATDYSTIRGFNYQPSYGSHGLETWGDKFDIALIKKELALGKQYFPKMNAVRLWLSYDAFIRQPDKMPQRFHSVIDLAPDLGVKFLPTLFNGWHSCPDFGGISIEMLDYWGVPERFNESFVPYLDAILKPHVNDERILLWDLCNEPFNTVRCPAEQTSIFEWLKRVHTRAKEMGVAAPLSVGATPGIDCMRTLEPLSDVITFHPYFAWNAWVPTPEAYAAFVDDAVAFGKSVGKPMLATETGWGAMDDKKRSEVLAVELGTLSSRKIGYIVHLLHHTLVADGHRPEYGPISGAGYMAFIEKDGSLRPYHEIYNQF